MNVSRAIVLIVVPTMAALLSAQSAPPDPKSLDAILRAQLQLSNSELSHLRQGRPVAKTLAATMPREMTTAGAVRIRGGAMPRFVDQFKTLEGFKTSQFVLQISRFSTPPVPADLDALEFEAEDVESLRECRVGACDVQLTADDIRRFNAEVNWRAPTAAADAAALYKSILFTHLTKYRTSGRSALPHYQDRHPGVHLAAEIEALLDAKPSLLEQVPAFLHYLRRFPAGADPNTEDFFYWSKEAFGFKPVVGLNHVSVHTDPGTGNVMIVTTQIYASHYMDGSIGFNALMPDRTSKNDPAFYWVFMNRSQVGRLSGFVGAIARPIMQRRARSGLAKSLLQTKQRFEAAQ